MRLDYFIESSFYNITAIRVMWGRQPQNKNDQSANQSTATNHSSGVGAQQSMLSPRHFMKLITKNIQEIASPRLSSIFGNSHEVSPTYSALTASDTAKLFGQYLSATTIHMTKHKEIQSKKSSIHADEQRNRSSSGEKNPTRNKQEIEGELILQKIPKQYFQLWDQQESQASIDSKIHARKSETQNNPIKSSGSLKQVPLSPKKSSKQEEHKSKKLQALLLADEIGCDKDKKKKKPLKQKQQDLQQHLDSVEFLIFGKTRKYPDRYLYYLTSFKQTTAQVSRALQKVQQFRQVMRKRLIKSQKSNMKVVVLGKKQQRIKQTLKLAQIMQLIHSFKKQSQQTSPSTEQGSLFKKIQDAQHSKSTNLARIKSIQQTLINVENLQKQNRERKLRQLCKETQKFISSSLSTIYSREQWLNNQLPKDALMKEHIGSPVNEGDDGALNSSCLNISILDQSYCVTAKTSLSQKVTRASRSQKVQKELISAWKSYIAEHRATEKLDEQQQQIGEIIQRECLKFHMGFQRDLQDYISYIYTHNSLPIQTPLYTNHRQRLRYIQPKFYNKILHVYFTGLSLLFKFTLKLAGLTQTKKKILAQVQSKINLLVSMRPIDEGSEYEDVSTLVSVLDYWSEEIAGLENSAEGEEQECLVMDLEQSVSKCRNKMVEEYLNCLHQHALVKQLKTAIDNSTFSPISVPLSSFSIINYILNWGQERRDDQPIGSACQLEDSINISFSMLKQLQSDTNHPTKTTSNKPSFSIFKIIDKVLIIQGTQYKMCDSFLPLAHYLAAYLHSKSQNETLAAKIDEKICELIGFYIWYNKKILFGVVVNGQKKTIRNLCMVANICNLILKILDILNITSNQKKLDKVLNDLMTIKNDIDQEISMVPFMLVEQQVSILYQSRLKTRKEIPTLETMRILDILEGSRKALEEYYPDHEHQRVKVKSYMSNCMRIISKNYFGYLFNMEARGHAELKWFLQQLKQSLADLFPIEIQNMEKQITRQ